MASSSSRAHPRSRGENPPMNRCSAPQRGSSPLTRGKPCDHSKLRFAEGLIPAHAGKTFHPGNSGGMTGAHPRSRGENRGPRSATNSHQGSSPLTRGKRPGPVPCPPLARLIPAHAGKTALSGATMSSPRAHPRSRGENAGGRRRACGDHGSSPLTRGKPGESGPR